MTENNKAFSFADLKRKLVKSGSDIVVDNALIKVFSDYISRGLFMTIEKLFGVPWTEDGIDSMDVDIDYFTSHGDRVISPLVRKLLERDDAETLNTDAVEVLARIIHNRYGKNWQRLYDTLKAQYNPIENYSMTETEKRKEDTTGGSNEDVTGKQDTSGSQNVTENKNSKDQNKNWGFNSTVGKPTNATTGTEDMTQNMSNSGAVDSSGNTKREYDETREYESEHKRSGNIGVTTSQQMIMAERDVWLYDFFDTIFTQTDKVLTIPYYDINN